MRVGRLFSSLILLLQVSFVLFTSISDHSTFTSGARVVASSSEAVLSRSKVELEDATAAAGRVVQEEEVEYELDLDVETTATATTQEQQEEIQVDATGEQVSPAAAEKTKEYEQDPQPYVDASKIRPQGFNYGRGQAYVAAQFIQKGEELFSIPRSQIMSLASARRARIGVIAEVNPTLPPAIILTLHLLEEKILGEASNFSASFLDALPTKLNGSIFFSKQEMELLVGSQLQRATQGRMQAIKNFYDALLPAVTSTAVEPPLFTKEQFTLENFAWAISLVWSQAFVAGASDEEAFIMPIVNTIADCVGCENHFEIDEKTGRMRFFATRDYEEGDEIRLNLGDKSSTLTMINYGMSAPPTENDVLQMTIFLDPKDPTAEIKANLLASLNMSMNDSYTLQYNAEILEPFMLKSLRLKLLKGNELEKFKEAAEGKAISIRNEFVVIRAILQTCQNLLRQYPSSLAQDRSRLSSDLPLVEKEILKTLIIEKEILQNTMDLAHEYWKNMLVSEEFVDLSS